MFRIGSGHINLLAMGPYTKRQSKHEQNKQELLNLFAETILITKGSLLKEFPSIRLSFDQSARNNDVPNPSIMYQLLQNEQKISYFTRKCPESASLAIIAFVIKVFGARVLNKGTTKINRQMFGFAIHILFGKDTHAIEKDLDDVVNNCVVTHSADNYKLCSEKYQINFPSSRLPNILKFINYADIDQGFFHRQSMKDVQNFFGDEDGVPEKIKEITGKNAQKPNKMTLNTVQKFIGKMTKGNTFYENSVKSVHGCTYETKATFLVNSAPSAIRKLKQEDRNQIRESASLPVNVWQVDMSCTNGQNINESTHVTLAGCQSNKQAAKAVLQGVIESKEPARHKVIIDLRALRGIQSGLVTGSEEGLYKRHVQVMREASTELGNIEYFPVHCEAHSHGSASLAFIAPKKNFLNKESRDKLSKVINDLFFALPENIKKRYRPILNKWLKLLPQLNHERNAIPFATLSAILADVISQNSTTDVEIIIGCKSAKDRTPAIVAGMNLLLPLIRAEVRQGGQNINRFFDNQGYFNPDDLTPEEIRLMKDLYDIRLLHAPNEKNTGVSANINSDLFIDSFFKNVDFIHTQKFYQSSPIHTVKIPS